MKYIGGFMGTINGDSSSDVMPPPNLHQASFLQAPTWFRSQALEEVPFKQACSLAVMEGVRVGMSCIMKKWRGKEDVQNCMVASFGSVVIFSLVSGFGGPNQASNVISAGIGFALVQGGLYKLMEKFSHPQIEDKYYAKTRSMLTYLGLQNYEKNFKEALLTDSSLSLLNHSDLKDVNIPLGPRLLILDYIKRDPELRQERREI